MIKKDSMGAWLIWIVAVAFFFFEYVIRVSPGVMVQQLCQDFHITAYSLGALSAFFYYAYVLMQIPVGILVDRYNARWLLGSMALLCATCAFLFSTTNTLGFAELSRLGIGITGAFAFVGALKLASTWFSPSRFGFLAGATQAIGMFGAAMGTGPLSIAVERIGWRDTLSILAGLVFILAIIIFIIVRDYSNQSDTIKSSITNKSEHSHSLITGILVVFKNPMTWINGMIVGLLYAPTGAFAELWGASYIHRVYHLAPETAASVISCIFIGWAIGGPTFGFFSDYIRKRKPIIIGSVLLSLLFLVIMLYVPNLPIPVLFVTAFLYGVSNVGVSTCYASACEINPAKFAGTSLGFANMASIILPAAFQPIIGWFLDLGWGGVYHNGICYYSTYDYQLSMLVLPICLVLCLILCIFLKESYGANLKEKT